MKYEHLTNPLSNYGIRFIMIIEVIIVLVKSFIVVI